MQGRIAALVCILSIAGVGCGLQAEPAARAAQASDALTATLNPAPVPGSFFWSGGDINEMLDARQASDLQALLQGFDASFQAAFARFENTPDPRPDIVGAGAGLKIYDATKTWSGYTLLTSLATDFRPTEKCPVYVASNPDCASAIFGAILVDMSGNVVKEWSLTGFPAKLLPGGYVLGGVMGAGGAMTSLVQRDWCDKTVAEWKVPQEAGYSLTAWHHDFERSGNPVGYFDGVCSLPDTDPAEGSLLLLANHVVLGGTEAISKFPLYDDAFYELDAKDTQGATPTWVWHAWEHIGDMGFDAQALSAIYNVKVPGGPGTDWTHMNEAARLGPNWRYEAGDLRFHPDNVIFDTRTSSILAIVARHDHPSGLWKSGDIVWRVGPNYGYGNPEYALGRIIGPHHTHMIPKGLPGEGNIMVFDNGGFSAFGSLVTGLPGTWPSAYRFHSRVLEFDPVTLKVVWEYAVPRETAAAPKFFSTLISNAQRLYNGNTLITQGGSGRVFEVTKKGEIVWDYVSPFAGRPFGGPGGLLGPNAVYRAYRVPKGWVPAKATCPLPAGWVPPLRCY